MNKTAPFFEEYEFRAWEMVLILLSVLLFMGSMYLYLTDYPLRRYLFNIEDEGRGLSIGTVSTKRGGLRRQFNGEAEFKSIGSAELLYNEDTVVTGSDGSATFKLDDGSSIEMAPNTMVRLHFNTNLTLAGISRAAVVDVVAGTVKPTTHESKVVIHKIARPVVERPRVALVQSKPTPTPTPTPVVVVTPTPPPVDPNLIKSIELISPRKGTQLTLDKGAVIGEKQVTFTWHVSPPDRRVQLKLSKIASHAPGARRLELFRAVVVDHGGQGEVNWNLKSPGIYEWDLRGPKGEPIPDAKMTSASFTLDPYFEAVETLEPLVGGEPLSSSRLKGKQLNNFDVILRWKPLPVVSKYRIAIRTQENAKPVLERLVQDPQYLFNKDRVFSGEIFYEIFAPLQNGFIAHSQLKPFTFTFAAPMLVSPSNHDVITSDLLDEDNILITWQKTNFTEWYELEIATNAAFTKLIKKQKLKDNFYVFKSPPSAKYFWRVRSSSNSVLSPFAAPFELTIQR